MTLFLKAIAQEPAHKKSEAAGWRPRLPSILQLALVECTHGRRAGAVSADDIKDRGAVRRAALLGGRARLDSKVAARDELWRAGDRSGIKRGCASASVPKVVRTGDVSRSGLDVGLAARRLRADVVDEVDTGARRYDTEAAVLIANGVRTSIDNGVVVDLNGAAGRARRIRVYSDSGFVSGTVGVRGEGYVRNDVVEDFDDAFGRIDRSQTDSVTISAGDDIVMNVDVVEVGTGGGVEHDAAAVTLEVGSDRVPTDISMVDSRGEVDGMVGLVYVSAGVMVVVAQEGPGFGRVRRLTQDAGCSAETGARCRAGQVIVDDADVARLSVDRGVAADDVEVGDGEICAPAMNAVAHRGSANIDDTTGVANDRELLCRGATTNVGGDAGAIAASIVHRNIRSGFKIDDGVLRGRAIVIGSDRVEGSAPGLERSSEATRVAVLTVGRNEDNGGWSHGEGRAVRSLTVDTDDDAACACSTAELSNDGVVAPGAEAAIGDERSAEGCGAAALRRTEIGSEDTDIHAVPAIAARARTYVQIGVVDVGSGSRSAWGRRGSWRRWGRRCGSWRRWRGGGSWGRFGLGRLNWGGCGSRCIDGNRGVGVSGAISIGGFERISRRLSRIHCHVSRSGNGASIQSYRSGMTSRPGQYGRLADGNAGRRG